MAPSSQRVYRAACPGCGAPVDFLSAASASAVCSFCRSTLVRDGQTLRRIGVAAELFDDHSPLQLGASGQYQSLAFTLVGRLQYGYAEGTWNEWHALFDNGRSGWLSEDNGAYVFSFDMPLDGNAPAADSLVAGQRCVVGGTAWDVASVTHARLIAAQGELPYPPRLEGEFAVVDLRNSQGEVGTLDYSHAATAHWSVGRATPLSGLALTGLRQVGEKTLGARTVECPSCGASLAVQLANTQTISCHQCQAVVDVSGGVGADLAHFAQSNSGRNGAEPDLPLGSTGTMSLGGEGALPWTVVGMVERCDIPTDAEDETTYWREYLLYNQGAGFVFLVDAEDGWSWMRPITGVPQVRGTQAQWRGTAYQRRYGYTAKVTWVQGEFYWRVRQDERALVTDYDGTGKAGHKRLSREQTGQEVTWSAGETIDASALARAFSAPHLGSRSRPIADATPLSWGTQRNGVSVNTVVWMAFFVFVLIVAMGKCSDDCDDVADTFGTASAEYQQCERSGGSGYRSSGGSYGGYSSGGGHK